MSGIPKPLYTELYSLCQAIYNCEKNNNTEWKHKHRDTIETLAKDYLPRGSGFNRGTTVDIDATIERMGNRQCRGEMLILNTSFHHMNDGGYYDRWTEHPIRVRPSFDGVSIIISGSDHHRWKDYAYECFYHSLDQIVWRTPDREWHSSLYDSLPTVS